MPDPGHSDDGGAVVVFATFPTAEVAASVARTLVEEQRCACVNLVSGVRSIYRWEGAVHDDSEVLAIIKTTAAGFEALTTRLVALHPYDVPEVIALPVVAGSAPYLAWLAAQVR